MPLKNNEAKHKLYIWNLFISLALLSTIGYFAVLPLRNATIRHIFVLMGSFSFFACTVFRMRRITIKCFTTSAIIVLIMLFGILSAPSVSFDNVYRCMCFFSLFIIMSTECTVSYDQHIERLTFWSFFVIALLMIMASYSSVAYVFEDGRVSGALALGVTNPNLTGMLLFGVYSVLIKMLKNRSRLMQIILVIVLIKIVQMIIETRARTSLIGVILITAYLFIFYKKKLPSWLIILGCSIPIVFVPLYLFLYNKGRDVIFLGKELFTGRQFIYTMHLAYLSDGLKVLFGNLPLEWFANAHNAPLSILCSIGIVGAVTVYASIYANIIRINNNASTPSSTYSVLVLTIMFIQSSAEALMFTGNFPCIMLLYYFMISAEGRLGVAKQD